MKKKGISSHDFRYKTIFSDPVMVESLVREFTPKEFVANLDFPSLTHICGTYQAENGSELINDSVWRIGRKNASSLYVAIMLEFQSTQNKWMPLRILNYTALLLTDFVKQKNFTGNLPPVLPIVLYNGKTPWKVAEDVVSLFGPLPEILDRYSPRQQYLLLDEGSIPEERLNRSTEPVLDVFKMERAHTPERIQEVVDRLYNLSDRKYDFIKQIFTAWVYQAMKSLDSTKEIPEPKNLQEARTMLAENMDQWKEQYREEGREKGREEGIDLGRGLLLLDLLKNRFGSLPDSVTSYIETSSDSDAITKFAMFATQAPSLQAVIDRVKVMTGTNCSGQTVQPA